MGNSAGNSYEGTYIFIEFLRIWWSRWDCKSAIEENRRKTAKFPSLLPLTDFSDVPERSLEPLWTPV
jgi:hypothetical protein